MRRRLGSAGPGRAALAFHLRSAQRRSARPVAGRYRLGNGNAARPPIQYGGAPRCSRCPAGWKMPCCATCARSAHVAMIARSSSRSRRRSAPWAVPRSRALFGTACDASAATASVAWRTRRRKSATASYDSLAGLRPEVRLEVCALAVPQRATIPSGRFRLERNAVAEPRLPSPHK